MDETTGEEWQVPAAGMLASLHRAVVDLRNRAYDRWPRLTRRLPVKVVSVGNLAVGGTGKTPLTAELAVLLSREGWLCGILSRGYRAARLQEPLLVSDLSRVLRGPSEAGDEPFLLARRLSGVPVVVGADRFAAAQFALERLPVNLFLLDDGFQHRRLARDVDIVLLDAADPWAGGNLLPAGRLREPRASLRRAHAVVLTRADRVSPDALARLASELASGFPGLVVFTARTRSLDLRPVPRGEAIDLAAFSGRRVLAVSGIARPAAFHEDLAAAGMVLAGARSFRDHHPYSPGEMLRLSSEAELAGAEAILTTEKDAVRMPAPPRHGPPVLALRSRVVLDDPSGLVRFLAGRLQPEPGRRR